MSRSKGLKKIYYPESEFGGYTRVDGTVPFFTRVQALARPEMTVLDVGCGRGAVADRFEKDPWEKCRVLKGVCKKVIGIDVTEAGRENRLIDEFRLIESDQWPVETSSIDLLLSDAVLEHIREPDAFFSECSRVVKPGGFACFRTPNRWGYPYVAATIIPNRLHAKVISIVQPGRKAHDVFPTYYRANTRRALLRLLKTHQFEGCVYRHISEPSYLGFSRWSYAFGVYLHRWLPAVLWTSLFVFARRIGDHRVQ
jgi:2-polyprenyl-3-methyl-5-hydroxy-6-metoxy-1,4-benzoquinol methylase